MIFKEYINPDSLQVIQNAYVEPSLKGAAVGANYQFIRKGYFCLDKGNDPGKTGLQQNRSLKDAWAKEANKR